MNESKIGAWLASNYGLPEMQCTHLRSHSNHTYLVASNKGRYILKLYGPLRHTDQEILWEIELLDHIAAHGGSVSRAVRDKNDRALNQYEDYAAVLFTYAPGEKPAEPFTNELYRNEGRALAKIHEAARDFASLYVRTPIDATYLIEKPAAYIMSVWENDDDKQFIQQFSQKVAEKIAHYADAGLDYGPIHGDATLDNFHITPESVVTWYDFDSGGPGWRAYDLQGWALLENLPEYLEKRDAFLQGYQEIRTLSPNDLAVSPYLHIASEIWGLGLYLERYKTANEDGALTADFIEQRITNLRNREQQLAALEQRYMPMNI